VIPESQAVTLIARAFLAILSLGENTNSTAGT